MPLASSPRPWIVPLPALDGLCRAILLWTACCCTTLATLAVFAAPLDNGGAERAVKAASIYRFLAYIEWPPSSFARPDSPLVIGVAGADELADELSRITADRVADGKPIQVRKLQPSDTLAGLHVLFIGRSPADSQAQLLRLALAHPILTVTDTEGALALGSMINFRLVDGRVRFEVSLGAAERSGLKISSRMLQVALAVRTEVSQ